MTAAAQSGAHTQGPWFDGGPIADIAVLKGGYYHRIAQCLASEDMGETEKIANAARIVACVNACEGIETDALTDLRVSEVLDLSANGVQTVRALRAEVERLRELAKHVQAMADDAHLSEHPEWGEICAEAEAAIGGGK